TLRILHKLPKASNPAPTCPSNATRSSIDADFLGMAAMMTGAPTLEGPGGAPSSIPQTETNELFSHVLEAQHLMGLFQPISNIHAGMLYGYEGLIRGPEASPIHTARELFVAAEQEGRRIELEYAAARTIVREFARRSLDGYLLLNLSCSALL